eukprot:16449581-Heterocapsa_arctica.AAC.1
MAGHNTHPTPWPDRDPMKVASDYIWAAQSPTPSPDTNRSLKLYARYLLHLWPLLINAVAICYTCGLYLPQLVPKPDPEPIPLYVPSPMARTNSYLVRPRPPSFDFERFALIRLCVRSAQA